MTKEAYLYNQLDKNKVRCNTCNHHCIILDNKRGICGIRENRNGKLYLLSYGLACAENIDPIEKKPLYHFMPKTETLTIATIGCNFRCEWCQNYEISQFVKLSELRTQIVDGSNLSPNKVVEDALSNNCPSISYSYTEPTVYLEYALDTMKIAHKKNIKNIWVSNGYMTKETLELISPYLDAINIDIKSINKKKFLQYIGGINPQYVLDNCKEIVSRKIHLEITTLIIPTINDSPKELEAIAHFIHDQLGPEIPWHLSRYFPAYKMKVPPTPIKTLEMAKKIGKKIGLKYVYLGNV